MTIMNNIPDWEEKYSNEEVETMPWFYPSLDPDFEGILDKFEITSGEALDIGTGAGSQAVELAKRGFSVTATDISNAAIEKAIVSTQKMGLNVSFVQDDILNSKLNKEFDIVFDRGCCHVFAPEKIPDYVSSLNKLIKPQGYLVLKCYSHLESDVIGPYCYRHEDIGFCFGSIFDVLSIKETLFYGTLDHLPKALVCVLRKI